MNRINTNIEKKKLKKETNKKNSNKPKNISQKKIPSKHPILKTIRNVFIIFIIIIIIISFLFYRNIQKNGGGIQGILCTIFGQSVESIQNLKPINVLVLGVSNDINIELTDTIILCSYNPKIQKISMLSIPRDTFIGKNKSSAKGTDKINSLYSKGIKKTINKVTDITGVSIDYYMVLNTKALKEIIDIVDGVEFNVPIDMDYDDPTQNLHIHLSSGMQKLNGEQTEQLLRFRHNNDGSSYPSEYGDNDFGRMKTQRAFLTELAKQTIDIKNLSKANKIIQTVFENIETNMSKEDLYQYIPAFGGFNMENIVSEQLPGESEKCNGLWFFLHNKTQTKSVIEKLDF